MLIDEKDARSKFCPFGRGAFPTAPGSGKFAAGVNMSPSSPLTMCEGSRCMLWETQQINFEAKQAPCPDCDGKGTAGCAKCEGTGTYTIKIPHPIGFCGAGFQGPIGAALRDIHMAMVEVTKRLASTAKERMS